MPPGWPHFQDMCQPHTWSCLSLSTLQPPQVTPGPPALPPETNLELQLACTPCPCWLGVLQPPRSCLGSLEDPSTHSGSSDCVCTGWAVCGTQGGPASHPSCPHGQEAAKEEMHQCPGAVRLCQALGGPKACRTPSPGIGSVLLVSTSPKEPGGWGPGEGLL